jgi:hypothetical protein
MGQSAEVPEQQIVHVAVQFLETAELLLTTRDVGGPSALLVNSAFAIELYLKSLNSRWIYHLDEDVLEDEDHELPTKLEDANDLEDGMGYIATSKSKMRSHDLSELFAELPMKDEISSRFLNHPLARKYSSIEQMLGVYAETFDHERYAFERKDAPPYGSRCVSEIVDLARFFREYVASVPTVRY